MDMKKVIGTLDYKVFVTCPECNATLDLVDYDSLVDYELSDNIFGVNKNGPVWQNLDLEFDCQYCNKQFLLDKIEY